MSDIKEIFKESIRKVIASINPGTADISGIGDGTMKGALRELNGKMDKQMFKRISENFSSITLDVGKSIDLSTKIIAPSGYTLVAEWISVSGVGSNGLVTNLHPGSLSVYSEYGCTNASVTHYTVYVKDIFATI